jgi:hypothetical protein
MADILEIFTSHSGLIVGTCWNNRRNTLYYLMRNTWFPLNCLWNQSVTTSRRNVTYIKRFVEVTIPKWCFFRLVSCYNLAGLLSYIHISPLLSYTIIIYSHDTRFPLSKLPVVTAQGGGGSFKDRKTCRRGELLWCMDGQKGGWGSEPLSLSLSLYLSIYLPIYLSISPSRSLSISLPSFPYLSISISISISISFSVFPSVCLSTYLSLSIYLSIHLSI